MGESFKSKFMHWLTFAILLLIVGGGLVVAYPTFMREQALKRQLADLDAKIKAKEKEIERLKEYKKRFQNDPDFVEMIARRNRKVFPGELVFVFDDE